MFTYRLLSVALLLASFCCSDSAHASLDVSDDEFLGWADPGAPASPGDEVGYIANLINGTFISPGGTAIEIYGQNNNKTRNYSREDSDLVAVFASPTETNADRFGSTSPDLSGMSYQYVLGKYGTRSYVWYFEDGVSDFEMPSSLPGGGLSHTSVYNLVVAAVPEPGSLIVWGGLALTGLCFCSRKWLTVESRC